MNWLDGAVMIALLIGTGHGARRGLGRAGFQLAGALGGVLAAYLWGEPVARELVRRVPLPEWLAGPIAIVLLAVGLALVGHVMGRAWYRWMRASALGSWDRWAGGLFGFALAAFICGVLLLAWIEWPGRPFPAAVEGSVLARRLLNALPAIYRQIDWILAPMR